MKYLSFLSLLILLASPARAAETQLQVWHQMIYSYREVLVDAAKEFERRNPGVSVKLTYRETEELRSAFQSSAIGGSGPDLVYGPSDQVGPFATMGIIRPLDESFSAEERRAFDPLALVRYQNHLYMVGDVVGNHLTLIYNKKLLAEPPKTTAELIELGKKLTRDTDGDGRIDQYGLAWNFTEPFFFVPWVAGFGDWFVSEDHRPRLDTPAVVRSFQLIKDLRDLHKIIPRECDYETANALFKEGKAAMLINGDWSWGDYRAAKVDFGIARIPMVQETGMWPSPLVSTKGYSINANLTGERLELATRLLKFLVSEGVQLEFARRVSAMPSHLHARENELVKKDPLLASSSDILKVGRPMPVVPEIRAVWDSLRGHYQAVLGGQSTPEEAARRAQADAEKQIRQMNEILTPGPQGKWIQGAFLAILAILGFFAIKGAVSFVRGFWGPNRLAYFLMAPAFIAIFAVIIYPFIYNVAISFSNLSLRTFNQWEIVGLQNYWAVLTDPNFYSVLLKTIIWTFVNVFFHVVIGVFLALVINQTLPAKPVFRTLLIIPWAVPQYITALTWRSLFHQEYGSINLALQKFLHMSPVQWLSQPFETFAACVITNVWLGFPFMMVIALGGLQAIPKEFYEAARVDGAGRFERFRSITMPMLRPVMLPAITLGMVWTFNNLNVIWLVSNAGEPADQTHILVSYVYKSAFNLYRYGYGAALSMIIFLILLLFGVLLLNKTKATESVY